MTEVTLAEVARLALGIAAAGVLYFAVPAAIVLSVLYVAARGIRWLLDHV